jgi:hypothetical protein
MVRKVEKPRAIGMMHHTPATCKQCIEQGNRQQQRQQTVSASEKKKKRGYMSASAALCAYTVALLHISGTSQYEHLGVRAPFWTPRNIGS